MKLSRAEKSEATFREAKKLAYENDMSLTCSSDGCFQLRNVRRGWIINMYPRRNGFTPRMYHDPSHRGPFLSLPENWTLFDAVKAAVEAEKRLS